MTKQPYGVYVHVPWCRRRCPYCAFYVEVDRDVPWDRFVDALLRERTLRASAFDGLASTLFLGGGTPSRMPPEHLARLLAGLPHTDDAEITLETNPEDVDATFLAAVRAAGVTRISLGVQTLDPRFAHLLNRSCTVDRAAEVLEQVRGAGFASWSVDLIFGLPDQSPDDVLADLERLLAAEPPHVSLYGLTIEPGTPFERAVQRGTFAPADAETWRTMYDRIVERLASAGIERYEVSNFAKEGHRSRHNRLYWTDAPYVGLGPSAHGYRPDGSRYANVRDAVAYLDRPDPTSEDERPTPKQAALDLLISALRSADGVPRSLLTRLGLAPDERLVRALVEANLLLDDPAALRLAHDGFALADGLAERLWDGLVPIRGFNDAPAS